MTTSGRVSVGPAPGRPGTAARAVLVVVVLTVACLFGQTVFPWHGDRSDFLLLSGVLSVLALLTTAFFRLRARALGDRGDRWTGLVFFLVGLHFMARLAMVPFHPGPEFLATVVRTSWVVTQAAGGLILLLRAASRLGSRGSGMVLATVIPLAAAGGGFLAARRLGEVAGGPGVAAWGVVLAVLFGTGALYSMVTAVRSGLERDVWLSAAFLVVAAAHAVTARSRAPYDPEFLWGHLLLVGGLAIPLVAALVESTQLLARQVRLTARMRMLRKRTEALLDSLPVLVLSTNDERQLEYANRSAASLLGVPPGLSRGIPFERWSAHITPQDRESLDQGLAGACQGTSGPWSGVVCVSGEDGGQHWLSVEAHASHDPVADEPRVQVVGSNISDLLLTRRAAERRQERLAMLANMAQTVAGETAEEEILERVLSATSETLSLRALCLLRTSPDGATLRAEAAAGAAPEACLAMEIPAGDHPAWAAFRGAYPKLAELSETVPGASEEMAAAGQVLFLPLLAAGRVVGVLACSCGRRVDLTSEDIDTYMQVGALTGGAVHLAELVRELDEQRQIALEASRLKSEFLANTSHELRTPLTSILGFLQLLRNGKDTDAQRRDQFLDLAHSSAQRLLDLINDVLDLAKIEAGRLEIQPMRFPVGVTLGEVESLFRHRSRAEGLHLEIAGDGALELWGDPDRTLQIITNLLANSFKFTQRGGRVDLEVTAQDGFATFTIRDTGAGIDPGELEKVFSSFYQVDGSTTRGHGGTGLGLTISRRLAEIMGGTLILTSRGEDTGTTATVRLPLAERQATTEP